MQYLDCNVDRIEIVSAVVKTEVKTSIPQMCFFLSLGFLNFGTTSAEIRVEKFLRGKRAVAHKIAFSHDGVLYNMLKSISLSLSLFSGSPTIT